MRASARFYAPDIESLEYPKLLRENQIDYLQQVITAGRFPPKFLVENVSSESWYAAMVALALRLHDPEILQDVTAGMGRGVAPTRTDNAPVVAGLGQTGIDVLELLAGTPAISSRSLLAVDCDHHTLKNCTISRKHSVPFGRARITGAILTHTS